MCESFRTMVKFKSVFNRVICVVLLSVILTVVVFVCFNRPKEVKAEPFTVGVMGVYALATALSAYLAGTGVNFAINNNSSVSSSNQRNILNNYVLQWVKEREMNAPSAIPDYFNNQGEYIGDEDSFTVIQDERNGVLNFIFGKELASALEEFKRDFISNHVLSTSPVAITPDRIFVTSGGNIPIYTNFSGYPISLVGLNDSKVFVLDSTHNFSLATAYNNATTDKATVQWGQSNEYRTFNPDYPFSVFIHGFTNTGSVNGDYVRLGLKRNADGSIVDFGFRWYTSEFSNIADFSLEGSLTDGYQDLEDAIDSDLTDATDENVVVVQSDEVPYPATWENIFPNIMDGVIGLNYDGVKANRDSVVNEVEGKPFVPVLPEGWVSVDGLQTFFPFCIPFDFYEIIKMLNVEAEAPKFTWKMNFAGIFNDHDIVIDLEPYEIVARVFRIMIVIVFLIFLTIKTRDLIRG